MTDRRAPQRCGQLLTFLIVERVHEGDIRIKTFSTRSILDPIVIGTHNTRLERPIRPASMVVIGNEDPVGMPTLVRPFVHAMTGCDDGIVALAARQPNQSTYSHFHRTS